MIWVIISILTIFVILIISAPLTNTLKNFRLLKISFFLGFSILSISTYILISYPSYKEFESNTNAIVNLKNLATLETTPPEKQMEEILFMVNKLAKSLESKPDNIEGWRALLQARSFLSQSTQIEKDKIKIQKIFKNNPIVLKDILDGF